MAGELRIGFIGCGGNAHGHMQQVAKDPEARITAVADVSAAAVQAAAKEFGAKPFPNHKAMLKACKLDAVYISIPPVAHGEPEFDVLDRGLPFFVEKPVALELETALRIAQRAHDTNALTCVGYQLRYTNAALGTRAFLADKTIGLALGRYHCGTGRGTGWLREFAQSGGQLVEQATHTIDMMRFLCGEITEVYSLQANRTLADIDCPDYGITAFKFADGALGGLTTVWALDPSVWDANVVDIFFDRYRLTWNTAAPTIAPEMPAFHLATEPRKTIDQVFLDAVRTGDRSEVLTPYDDAVRSLAVSVAASTSVHTGAPQPVPAC
jgi:myo-inositol 2-dehydrogenase / D-chiro-inositol 1-dehydrogenase